MSLARRALALDDEIQAAASRVVDITPWVLPLLLTVIVYANTLLSSIPLFSLYSPPPIFVSFLSRVLSPRPCLAPVSSTGSGPFVSPAWSAISIHSFPPPPFPCKGCLLSSRRIYLLAPISPVPRSKPGTSRGVLSPSGYPSPWYRRPAPRSLLRGTIASLSRQSFLFLSAPNV